MHSPSQYGTKKPAFVAENKKLDTIRLMLYSKSIMASTMTNWITSAMLAGPRALRKTGVFGGAGAARMRLTS
jgi:hypothetical protein